jgi:hypothetical protein
MLVGIIVTIHAIFAPVQQRFAGQMPIVDAWNLPALDQYSHLLKRSTVLKTKLPVSQNKS